jgi:hypothetical protein
MEFNSYVWDLYRNSRAGAEAIRRYSQAPLDMPEIDLRILEYPYTSPTGEAKCHVVDVVDLVQSHAASAKIASADDAAAFFDDSLVKNAIPIELPDHPEFPQIILDFRPESSGWYDFVGAISLGLHRAHPDYYVPYLFRRRFDKFARICEEFGIPLAQVPGKGSKGARARYYSQINHALFEFRKSHGLTPAELCAFLYDFAENHCGADDATKLPEPSKVWLLVGGDWDFEDLDRSTNTTVLRWSGNPGTRKGDIILMYCVAPRSHIHSIWRARSDGYVDPFSHYHGNVAIGDPMQTVPVTYGEMSRHKLLSKKPEVKARLQGTGGKPFSVREYEAVLEMMREKGQDLSLLPRMPVHIHALDVGLFDERDVEIHLIEPFLKRLGYSDSDWIQQMPVKMGRGERNYPDYAIGAIPKRGEERAKMLVESKFQLSVQREFEDAYYQAKSYALRLQSKIFLLAAFEGIWIFQYRRDDFDIKRFEHKTWGELADADVFHNVLALIGRDVVLARPSAARRPSKRR